MKNREYRIEINLQLGRSGYINELEKVTAALHGLMEVALHEGAVANHPEFQSLMNAAGNANAALFMAKNPQVLGQGGPQSAVPEPRIM